MAALEATGGYVLWFTGLSGAGKTTIARAIVERFSAGGSRVELLDGDEVREHLSKGLGFSRADRDTNIGRIGYVARLLARNGSSPWCRRSRRTPTRGTRSGARARGDSSRCSCGRRSTSVRAAT